MKKNTLRNILLVLLVLISSSFTMKEFAPDHVICETVDSNSEDINAAYRSFLSGMDSRKWKASSFTIAGFTQQCRLDDQFEFHADGTYTYYGGENLCGDSPSDLSKTGTWSINGSDRNLTFDSGTEYEYTANIVNAKNGSLELKGTYYLLPIRGKYTN